MNVETLTNKMELQRGIVDFLKLKLEENEAKYERVHKLLVDVVRSLVRLPMAAIIYMSALVDQVVICKRYDRVVQGVVVRSLRGGDTRRSLVPQPSLLVESFDPVPKTCTIIEKCAFFGLGFSLVWVARFASCKHVYHEWCALYYFAISIKCVQQGCGEEMHDLWWISVGFKNLPAFIEGINQTKSQQPRGH
jgi:hypothetical protein